MISVPTVVVLVLAIYFSVYSGSATGTLVVADCIQFEKFFDVTFILLLKNTCLCILFAVMLRSTMDTYGLKKEFSLAASLSLVLVIFYVLVSVTDNFGVTGFSFYSIPNMVGGFGISIISLWRPALMVMKTERNTGGRKQSSEAPSKVMTLDSVERSSLKKKAAHVASMVNFISTEIGYAAFEKHLTGEFSIENLMFYSDITALHKLDVGSLEKIELEAQRIYSQYICNDSPFEINISTIQKHELEQLYDLPQQLDEDPEARWQRLLESYDSAFDEIARLMASDAFRRFKYTDEYQAARAQIQTELESEIRKSTIEEK